MAERFDITQQVQTIAVVGSNRAVPVMRVTFTAKPSRVEGSVEVPLEQYTAETVARMVLERVDAIDEVQSL